MAQGIMKGSGDLGLQIAVEIDEKISTGNEVYMREGRVTQNAVLRKHDQISHFALDTVVVAFAHKKSAQPLLRHVRLNSYRIACRARNRQRARVEVGGKYLYIRPFLLARHLLEQQDGNREDLFSRGASRHPDPDRTLGPTKQPRHDLACKRLKGRSIAEEARHRYQKIRQKRLDLLCVLTQMHHVTVER